MVRHGGVWQSMWWRLEDLHERAARGPTGATFQRLRFPSWWTTQLGIAALEDKDRPAGCAASARRDLSGVLGFSYGFRPGRSAPKRLDSLWVGLIGRRIKLGARL